MPLTARNLASSQGLVEPQSSQGQQPSQGLNIQEISSKGISHTGARTKAAEVRNMVREEITSRNCHVAPTPEFLGKLFPVADTSIDKIFDELISRAHYDNVNKRWNDMPPPNTTVEKEYYAPFAKVANAITEACRDTHTDHDFELMCRWLDRHSKNQSTTDKLAALIRPDILASLATQDDADQLDQLIENAAGDHDEILKQVKVWWTRSHIPAEIKPTQSLDILEDLNQLLTYMRFILKEQLNRRFVYGLLLCESELSVWLSDRSGVLGTQQQINIHKNPRWFIRVIAGMSLLPPDLLGYDTTMKLCKVPLTKPPTYLPAFSPLVTLKDYGDSLYDTHWAIDMPSKDGKGRTTFITTRALSIAKVEILCGRATIAWAAFDVEDLEGDGPYKIRVLKQYWRPAHAKSEGEIYQMAKKTTNTGRIYCFEDVLNDNVVVDTAQCIRRGLVLFRPNSSPNDRKRKIVTIEETEGKESYRPVVPSEDKPLESKGLTDGESCSVESRFLTRLALEDYGWPLTKFCDIREFLRVTKDNISGHHDLYFNEIYSILQGDASIGNMLICITDNGATLGRLIDLDNAKIVTAHRWPIISEFATSPGLNSDSGFSPNVNVKPDVDQIEAVAMTFKSAKHPVSEVFASWAAQNEIFAWKYLKALKVANPAIKENSPLSDMDVGFIQEKDKKVPKFDSYEEQGESRSATFPFASAEVLRQEAHMLRENEEEGVVHDAIHDLEAMFWVITYVCMTRDGPGGKRRPELKSDYLVEGSPPAGSSMTLPDIKRLQILNYAIFSAEKEDLIYNKTRLFIKDHYEEYIIPCFHPYFEPIIPLMLKWWKILRFAHKFYLEDIHGWILKTVNDELAALPETKPTQAEIAVALARKRDLEALQPKFHHNSKDVPKVLNDWDISPSRPLLTTDNRPDNIPKLNFDSIGGSSRLATQPVVQRKDPPKRAKRS